VDTVDIRPLSTLGTVISIRVTLPSFS